MTQAVLDRPATLADLFADIRRGQTSVGMRQARKAVLAHPECTVEALAAFLTDPMNEQVLLPSEPDDTFEESSSLSGIGPGATCQDWQHTLKTLFAGIQEKGGSFGQLLAVYESDGYRKSFYPGRCDTDPLRKAFAKLSAVEQLDNIELRVKQLGVEHDYGTFPRPLTLDMLSWFTYQTVERGSDAYHFSLTLHGALQSVCLSDSERDKPVVLTVLKHIRSLL